LFDSGASHHMSPHRYKSVRYEAIPARSIHAADLHTFKAVSKADMYITIPNGKGETTRVLL
ncbi:uncharacterized protein TRAVEDRAFT_77987, partial [Trametes versicolor FP-101664 SS1]|uniref:uncharacterized protein n=1 Tax=Trametes versicolor (strain FP-101664) TaxID=717944 RepID=UPI00046244A2